MSFSSSSVSSSSSSVSSSSSSFSLYSGVSSSSSSKSMSFSSSSSSLSSSSSSESSSSSSESSSSSTSESSSSSSSSSSLSSSSSSESSSSWSGESSSSSSSSGSFSSISSSSVSSSSVSSSSSSLSSSSTSSSTSESSSSSSDSSSSSSASFSSSSSVSSSSSSLSESSSSSESISCSATTPTYGPALISTNRIATVFNYRILFGPAELSVPGTQLMIRLADNLRPAGYRLRTMYIEQQAPAGNPWDFIAPPTQITFNGGSSSVIVSAGSPVNSDCIIFTIVPVLTYVISFYIEGPPIHPEKYLGIGAIGATPIFFEDQKLTLVDESPIPNPVGYGLPVPNTFEPTMIEVIFVS